MQSFLSLLLCRRIESNQDCNRKGRIAAAFSVRVSYSVLFQFCSTFHAEGAAGFYRSATFGAERSRLSLSGNYLDIGRVTGLRRNRLRGRSLVGLDSRGILPGNAQPLRQALVARSAGTRLNLPQLVFNGICSLVDHLCDDIPDATELMVKIEQDEKSYHIEISDNGSVSVSSITEGNGFSALRQRLEQEGASLKVLCDNSVSLIIDIPFDFDEAQKGGRT